MFSETFNSSKNQVLYGAGSNKSNEQIPTDNDENNILT